MASMYGMKTILILALCVGCASMDDVSSMSDDPADPGSTQCRAMDASGTWESTLSWTSGTCGLTLTAHTKMIIAHSDDGYTIADASPTTTVTGFIECSCDSCHASLTEVGPGRGDQTKSLTVSAELDVLKDGRISGTGGIVYEFVDGNSCNQLFTATGVRS